MYCIKCGKQIKDGTSFCIYCGAPTNKDAKKPGKQVSTEKKNTAGQVRNSMTEKKNAPHNKPRQNIRPRSEVQPKHVNNKKKNNQEKNNKGLIIGLIIAIAAAIAAVLCIWFFLIQPKLEDMKNTKAETAEESSAESSDETSEKSEAKSRKKSAAEESSTSSESSEEKSSDVSSSSEKSAENSGTEEKSRGDSSASSAGSADRSEESSAAAATEAPLKVIAEYTVSSASAALLENTESADAEVIAKAKKGDTIDIIEYGCDGYWDASFDGKRGFVNPAVLEFKEGDLPDSYGSLYAVGDTGSSVVNMYSEPNASDSSIKEQIPSGEKVEYYDLTNNAFCLVEYNGALGYVEEIFLKDTYTTPSPSPADTPSPTPTAAPTPQPTQAPSQNGYGSFTVAYTSDYVTLRDSASLSGNSIIRVNLNQKVFVYELAANGYYRVNYNGTDGYMLASYLVPDSGAATPAASRTMTVQGDYLTLRYWPSNSTQEGDEIFRISGGEQVEFIETAEYGYYFVRYNGRLGFVMSAYLN